MLYQLVNIFWRSCMTILPECKTRSVHAWLPHQILGLIFRPETHSRHNNSDDPLHSSIDEEFEVLFCTLHADCLHHFNNFLKNNKYYRSRYICKGPNHLCLYNKNWLKYFRTKANAFNIFNNHRLRWSGPK